MSHTKHAITCDIAANLYLSRRASARTEWILSMTRFDVMPYFWPGPIGDAKRNRCARKLVWDVFKTVIFRLS